VVDPFYRSAEWIALASAVVVERGHRCEDPNCKTPHGPWRGLQVDHVKELRELLDEGLDPLDRANLLVRCSACHLRKTLRARRERMRRLHGSAE
jgi:5-methylcytosine-specific restriction endonuclease McrA